jgi:hypothetical protein
VGFSAAGCAKEPVMFGKKLSSSAMVLGFEDESRGVPLAKAKRRKLASFEWIAKVPRPLITA